MKKSVNLYKYSPFFIISPLPVMLKFTFHITAVHLFTCVAKAVMSRRSREFLRKKGEKSYHDASAYRPISLTSYLCKSLERIVTHRLYGFSEHFNLLGSEQEGFKRFLGTTDALLRISQDIYNGFNNKEHTAALFIDIEKAYDSVWREGLMFKLHKREQDSSPTRQFTDTFFEDSSPTDLKTVHRHL